MYNVEDEQKIYICILFFFFEEIVSSNIGSNFDPRRSNYMQRSECQRGGGRGKVCDERVRPSSAGSSLIRSI